MLLTAAYAVLALFGAGLSAYAAAYPVSCTLAALFGRTERVMFAAGLSFLTLWVAFLIVFLHAVGVLH